MAQKAPSPEEKIRIEPEEMYATFLGILLEHDVPEDKATRCARLFTDNTVDGVYSHGANRFPRFVRYLREGYIRPSAEPELVKAFGGLERWHGNLGIGLTNAQDCTERAMALAEQHGLGCVALSHTNHWMRGGAYAWQAARAGFLFIGWTNTIGNMPAWGAVDRRLGNNPLILGVPFGEEAVVLDMAASQFSYGAMEAKEIRGEKLPLPGGYDDSGNLTDDPSAILAAGRPLPAGYWKGAGLALLLDLFATVLAGGLSTAQVSAREVEYGLSQLFLVIDPGRVSDRPAIYEAVQAILDDLHASELADPARPVRYPGEKALHLREENRRLGVPVDKVVWEEILSFRA